MKKLIIIFVLSLLFIGCEDNPTIKVILSPVDCFLSGSANEAGEHEGVLPQ